MLTSQTEKALNLASILAERVVGQDHAMEMIARRVQTSRAGLGAPEKPVGVFLLCGPSGVGKTETALALAETLYGGEQNLITINMSEFQEAHTVSLLKGAPPGYVGYGKGGVLTEAVRRKPYSVVLFDEIEKAHPEVFNALLQLLDDGRLTDGHGRTVDFKNTVVIMTSNIGSELWGQGGVEGTAAEREAVLDVLRRHFRPEFLNRVDEIVVFHSLNMEHLTQIVDIQLERVRRLLAERGLKLSVSEAAKAFLAREGWDPTYGARPLKRTIQRVLQDPLALKLLQNEFREGQAIHVDFDGEGLTFTAVVEGEPVSA
jgi:ATP-dependent Clp protease ATP-binding subunit ClpB